MKLLFIPQPIACDWCDVPPGAQHDRECPEREDGNDWPAFCHRCGVAYITSCNCDQERDR
jgi:hypothetical protein